MNDYFEIFKRETTAKIASLEILESDDEINSFDRGLLAAYRKAFSILEDVKLANDMKISYEKLSEMKAS